MKRKITISGSISGVISTGSFENMRPDFTWQEEIEDCTLTDEQVQERRIELFTKSLALLKEAEAQATVDRINRDRKDIRFYTTKEGDRLPSVTSVINWDIDFFVPPHELSQYASQSNIVHKRVELFILDGEWLEPKAIQDCWSDIVICSKGNLGLEIDTGSFPDFLKEYPIKEMENGHHIYLENTAGLPDFSGIPDKWMKTKKEEWTEVKPILTVFDVKRTPDKIKDGMQLSQYCKGYGAKQGIIIPLNDKTQQGFSKPVVYDEKTLEGYDKMFQKKREDFKKRYGI